MAAPIMAAKAGGDVVSKLLDKAPKPPTQDNDYSSAYTGAISNALSGGNITFGTDTTKIMLITGAIVIAYVALKGVFK